jgi:hypothetical protein
MLSRSLNDISKIIRMMIVGDATTYSVTSDYSRGVIYDRIIFIIEVTVFLYYRTTGLVNTKVCTKIHPNFL